ncbi:DUF1302 domain-containing protein [Noviherbaspirillum saxi]|uniref:DUF1302 family protein n=1 Tax=Noviherbaspirillum saxi TaxID=2320863 RepID=A0A3A3G2J5_9BURK|nr:DUF1302 family protein [Noviherbaspirillum saxi]RJF92283.1 DUF1302 family protein [Noviherbaspirillum saxi]
METGYLGQHAQRAEGKQVTGRTVRHALLLLASLSPLAQAAPLIDDAESGLKVNWDNTVKYTAAARVGDRDSVLTGPINLNDGDNNFGRGLISNRLDFFTELDAVYRDVGARVSAAGWYDSVYNRPNDNPGPPGAFVNHSSAPYNEFTAATRKLHGRNAELMDAFLFGKLRLGGGDLAVRLGQHSLLWGESLFFAGNAIAGGQMPTNVARLVSVPNSQAKEFVLPVPQVSSQWQLSDDVSVGAYYQFRYRANRLPAVGSYFSQSDTNFDGAERLLLGPVAAAPRGPDMDPKDSGQGGVQLRWRIADTDLGFYALRFHSKGFQQVTRLAPGAAGPVPASYYLTHHEGIRAYGLSASHTFGQANVAIEASVRHNQDLASAGAVDASALAPAGVVPANNNRGNPAYAVGRTAHANVSMLWTLPHTPLFDEANLVAEGAWNRVLSCQTQCARIAPTATRDAVSFRLVLEPIYRQVVPGLDLGVPLGLGFTPKGSRSMALGPGGLPAENGGDVSIGVNGLFRSVWKFNLNYTHYFGPVGPFLNSSNTFSYKQGLADRDVMVFTLTRTF